jgi:hypothetical protein
METHPLEKTIRLAASKKHSVPVLIHYADPATRLRVVASHLALQARRKAIKASI